MTFASVPLREDQELELFDSGQPVLDEWLRCQALRAQLQDTARTYTWTKQGEIEVLAYYSIVPTQVHRAAVSRAMSGGVSTVPAYLLAKLALDRSLQGRGLGTHLLLDALEVIVRASTAAAGRLILVDAIGPEAHAFYRKHDFQPITGSMRLVMKTSTARAALMLGPADSDPDL